MVPTYPSRSGWFRKLIRTPQLVVGGTLAVWRLMGALVHGRPLLAPPEVVDRRMILCEACSFHYRDSMGALRCSDCQCYLAAKTTLTTESCPVGRW